MKAYITEIFSSIQGEGPYAGEKQIFVRFKACNMRCAWCDVPPELAQKEYDEERLMDEINRLDADCGPHHSVSLTGGEPLLCTEFLKEFLKRLKASGRKVYLETNGTLPERLSEIIDYVDIVAMDFKLPSSTRQRDFWKEHEEFLKVACRKEVFVKAVVSDSTTEEDIGRSTRLISAQDKLIPFILQPVEAIGGTAEIANDKLLRFLNMAEDGGLAGSAIIPQVHKILGVR